MFGRKYSIVGYTYTDCPILFYKWIHRGQYRHFLLQPVAQSFIHLVVARYIFSGLPGYGVKYYLLTLPRNFINR